MNKKIIEEDLNFTELSLAVPIELLAELRKIARDQGFDHHDLAVNYIHDGILSALPQVKRRDFFKHTQELLRKHRIPENMVKEFPEKFTY